MTINNGTVTTRSADDGVNASLDDGLADQNATPPITEAYLVAGEIGFGWWLVEHYLSYHENCPDGCGLGEPVGGRKDPPYFQMSYGSLNNIADLVDTLVESFLPL